MGETESVGLPGLLVAGIIGMILLAMAIIVFFIVYQRRLLRQQQEMNRRDAEYQKELLLASIQSQESERKRIASDLHDSVGVMLSATKIYLKQINPETTQSLVEIKKESIDLIEETIINIRQISHDLLPPNLERFGFIAAVEDLSEKINVGKKLSVHFSSNQTQRFAQEKEISLYRVVQELINNTIKHAKASNIYIDLNFENKILTLSYRDDGIGFDIHNDSLNDLPKKGLGLRNLESRVNAINATFSLDSKKGKGFKVTIAMPL